MIDITATREMATRNHPPLIVFLVLGGVILDLEFPRLGLIRTDSADEALAELRESMQ